MPTKILLIENDAPFAAKLTGALEAAGWDVRTTGDGRDGFELARDLAPAAIVLCVELPKMSGYIICQKLKKDDALKSVPLVLTSSEATPETFEKHRQLKGRAEAYLLKPFEPSELVDHLRALVGAPEVEADDDEGEVLALDEELSIEPAGDVESLGASAVADLAPLDLDSLPDEPAAAGSLEDDALRLLDDAFDGIATSPAAARAPAPAAPADEELGDLDLDAAAASLPDVTVLDELPELAGPDAPAADLEDETERALGALGDFGLDEEITTAIDDAETTDEGFALDDALPPPVPAAAPFRGASPDALRAAELALLGEVPRREVAPPPAADRSPALEAELRGLREELEATGAKLRAAEAEATARRAALEAAERRADDADGRIREVETRARDAAARLEEVEADAARLEARAASAESAAADARRRADEAEAEVARLSADAGKVDALERELEDVKTDLVVARGELDGARGEVEKRTAELRKRVEELEAQNAKNEERVLRAYQKIKSDEKLREKTRKALTVALQLLDEGLPAEAEARAKVATLLGRE